MREDVETSAGNTPSALGPEDRGLQPLRVAHHRPMFQRDFICLAQKISQNVFIKSSFWCQQWILLYYWKESKAKVPACTVNLSKQKMFLKKLLHYFYNKPQPNSKLNKCSFKTNLFFFNHRQKYFLCFHSSANTSPPYWCRLHREPRDLPLMVFLLRGHSHWNTARGWWEGGFEHINVALCPFWFVSLFDRTMNAAKICLRGTSRDGKGSHPSALIWQEPRLRKRCMCFYRIVQGHLVLLICSECKNTELP